MCVRTSCEEEAIALEFCHGIRAILVYERILGLGSQSCRSILEVFWWEFGGKQQQHNSFIDAWHCLKDQVVPLNLVFWFAAIQVTVCKIRPFEGESAESAKGAEFAFLQKSQI